MYGRSNLAWDGLTLRLGTKQGRKLIEIVPDPDWPKMFRIQRPDGTLTDMVNLTRAKDAAISHALMQLNR
jgi:hypothetical protein